jgi:hypothetical protein
MQRRWGFVLPVVLFSISTLLNICAKEMLCEANSTLKQIKFTVRSGDIVFTEKYQNINGKVTETWHINNSEVLKDEYFKQMLFAEKEEEQIRREAEELKRLEEERRRQELLSQKQREEEAFIREAKLQTLKKLVNLELKKVEKSFVKLDKYELDQFFVFEEGSFSSLQSLEDIKIGLVSLARELIIRPVEELEEDELKQTLSRLEAVPDKVERFFRQSVKYAINQCSDTRRLKELLALI